MIICNNCGATNNTSSAHFCRKCGALLPVSTPQRSRKITINSKKKEKEILLSSINLSQKEPTKTQKKNKANQFKGELHFFTSSAKKNQELSQLELKPIPNEKSGPNQSKTYSNSSNIINRNLKKINLTDIPSDNLEETSKEKLKFLQEIKPKPFEGSIISFKSSLKPKSKTKIKTQQSISKSSSKIPSKFQTSQGDSTFKMKRLEEDMSDVLKALSKKLRNPKAIHKLKPSKNKKPEEKIHPTNMNEILKQLLTIDTKIEASAIIKEDGTILASAISNRISDTLFATIGQNLSLIGIDIIEGLNAGYLKSISIRGTEGILDLAPIDKNDSITKDMILLIFSHPKVKSGIINIATNLIKRQIKIYLGIDK
ncbi:MAG: hypothetical protein ACFFAN_03020 [Promethearchaeota archaeon]